MGDGKCCRKMFPNIILACAIILALAASFLSPEHMDAVILASRFLDIMLPVLAVGALIKYLYKSRVCCCHKSCQKENTPLA